jgi:hypothetical protein
MNPVYYDHDINETRHPFEAFLTLEALDNAVSTPDPSAHPNFIAPPWYGTWGPVELYLK